MSRARDFWLTHAVVLAAFLIGVWVARRNASEPSPPELPAREPPVEPPRPSPVSDRDRYLELHRLASDFMRFEGTLVWARFSGMVAFNAILIGFYGVAVGRQDESTVIRWLIPLVGIATALIWGWLTHVGMGYHDAWKEAMRDAEYTLYGAHATNRILQDVRRKTRKARWFLGDWGRAHKVQYYVIVGIAAVYAFLLAWFGADDVWGWIVDFSAEIVGSAFTSVSAVAAAVAAIASWRSAHVAQRALLADQRPLLVNVRAGSPLALSEGPGQELGADNPGLGLAHAAKGRDGAMVYSLPFRNGGTGTAVITDASIAFRVGADFQPVPEAWIIGGLAFHKYAPAGELARIAFASPKFHHRWWTVSLTYSNLDGSETFTTRFDVSPQRHSERFEVEAVEVTPRQG